MPGVGQVRGWGVGRGTTTTSVVAGGACVGVWVRVTVLVLVLVAVTVEMGTTKVVDVSQVFVLSLRARRGAKTVRRGSARTSGLAGNRLPDGGAAGDADVGRVVAALGKERLVGVTVVSGADAARHGRQGGGSEHSLHRDRWQWSRKRKKNAR